MSKFYRCGGCQKKGAYFTTSVSKSGVMFTVQCRYCGAMRSGFSHDYHDSSAGIALTLTPGPRLSERFTPAARREAGR